jgi:Family of unknown function (DUF6174)
MKKIGWIFLIILVAGLPACSSPERQAYEKNHTLWESQAIRHYRIHFEIGCMCPWAAMMPLTVEVLDGEIVSMVAKNGGDMSNYLDTFRQHATIESQFVTVDSAISKRVYKLAVQYNATYGFPTSIVVDPSRMMTDDATGYYVTDFETLP